MSEMTYIFLAYMSIILIYVLILITNVMLWKTAMRIDKIEAKMRDKK